MLGILEIAWDNLEEREIERFSRGSGVGSYLG
jgi:hypothetical protein